MAGHLASMYKVLGSIPNTTEEKKAKEIKRRKGKNKTQNFEMPPNLGSIINNFISILYLSLIQHSIVIIRLKLQKRKAGSRVSTKEVSFFYLGK